MIAGNVVKASDENVHGGSRPLGLLAQVIISPEGLVRTVDLLKEEKILTGYVLRMSLLEGEE